jgi:hypothetical protein
MFGCSSSFITAISRSSPYGIGLCPEALIAMLPFVLSMRFAKLCARVVSAAVLVMILTAPYWFRVLCLTSRTREQPPFPIVFPNCQWPMYVFRLRPEAEALVEVVDMAEFRFESRPCSLAI